MSKKFTLVVSFGVHYEGSSIYYVGDVVETLKNNLNNDDDWLSQYDYCNIEIWKNGRNVDMQPVYIEIYDQEDEKHVTEAVKHAIEEIVNVSEIMIEKFKYGKK